MSPDRLAAIEARANAVSRDRMGMSDPAGDWMICTHASQQDVPALVAEVRRLQAKCGEDGTRPIEITGSMARRVAETMHVLCMEPLLATVMVDGRRRDVVRVAWSGPGQVEKIVVQP